MRRDPAPRAAHRRRCRESNRRSLARWRSCARRKNLAPIKVVQLDRESDAPSRWCRRSSRYRRRRSRRHARSGIRRQGFDESEIRRGRSAPPRRASSNHCAKELAAIGACVIVATVVTKPEPLALARAPSRSSIHPSRMTRQLASTKAAPSPRRVSVRRLLSSIPVRASSCLLLSVIASPAPAWIRIHQKLPAGPFHSTDLWPFPRISCPVRSYGNIQESSRRRGRYRPPRPSRSPSDRSNPLALPMTLAMALTAPARPVSGQCAFFQHFAHQLLTEERGVTTRSRRD